MSSARNQHSSTFPAVPPSLSAGDHGIRDYHAAQNAQRPTQHTLSNITPYLGLRSRLSQVWINRWTILLLLVLARTLIAITGLHNDLGSAKSQALSACSGVEQAGSALASMPHFLAQGVNDLTATSVEKAVNGLMSMLMLSITGVEELVVFYINLLTSTYVCLITLAVAGSLHVAIQIAEDVTNFLNNTLGTIRSDIINDVSGFQNDLNKFIGAFNSVPQAFGAKTGAIPTLNIDDPLNSLNVTLPSTIDEGLNKLNSSIPDFAQVNNFTNSVIRLPFEEVKKLVNESLGVFHLDRSIFPVPQKEQLTFCSDNNGISDFFQDLDNIAYLARKIFIAVLLVAAILVCIPMAYREIMRWRSMQERAKLVQANSHDPMDVIYIASRPYTSAAGIKASERFNSTKGRLLTRWFFAYITSAPSLFVLSLALAGLFSCLCQYILLKAVDKEVPALVNEVGDFAGKVVSTLNNASEQWSIGTNNVILSTNNDINKDLFGWVNTTTGALNDTLNTFVDGMTKTLNATFGGTVLYDPITEVLNCLIGLKIVGIQKALDWVSDNAHVDFPLLPNNTFSLGAAASIASNNSGPTTGLFSDPTQAATDDISAAVLSVTDHIASAIRTEALISTAVLLIWLFIVLLGLSRACFLSCIRIKNRGEGGPSYAGDIPLETHRPMSSAPAYEPPRPNNPFESFQTPMPGPRNKEEDTSDGEWQDQKLGFAGERGPVGRVDGVGHVRQSSHGFFIDQKR